jgi:hypothetical protein
MTLQEALTYDISWVAESVKRYTGFDGDTLSGAWNAMQAFIRQIPALPEVEPRRPLDNDRPDEYLESDKDFVKNNFDACVLFLENRDRLAVVTEKAGSIPAQFAEGWCDGSGESKTP